MSKNKQIMIWALVAVAVLGAVTAVLLLTAPKKETQEEDTSTSVTADIDENNDLMLFDHQESELAEVSVTNADGTYSITPSGKTDADGKILWTIADIETAPLDNSTLSTAAGYAVSFEAREFVEEVADSSVLAKYGLAEPRSTVTAKLTDGTEFTFKIGDEVPSSASSIYMTVDGKTVYTCYKTHVTNFLNNKYSYVDLKAIPDYDTSSEEIVKMTIERVDLEEPLVIEMIPGDDNEDNVQVYAYRLTSPYYAYMDLTDAPTFLYSIFGLTASACEVVGLDENDRNITGLSAPNCTVTVETNVRTYTLTIGNGLADETTDENGNTTKKLNYFYGVSGDYPDVLYKFAASNLEVLTIQPQTLISKLFLMPYIYSLKSVTYSDPSGRSVDIGIETIKAAAEGEEDIHNFTLNGEPTEDQPVKNLYQYLISAAGEDLYFDEDKGDLIAEITYNYIDPNAGMNGKDIVRLYSSNTDRKVIINLNGENLFKTRQMYATQLVSNIDKFLSGEEIVLTY